MKFTLHCSSDIVTESVLMIHIKCHPSVKCVTPMLWNLNNFLMWTNYWDQEAVSSFHTMQWKQKCHSSLPIPRQDVLYSSIQAAASNSIFAWMQQILRKETPIYSIFCLFNPAVYTRVPTRSIFCEIFIFSCLEAVFRSNFWGCYTSNSISISISKCFKAWNELESCVASVKTMKMMTMRNLRWPHMKTPRLPRTFGPRLLWPLARAPWHKNLTPRTSSETWDNVRLRIPSSSSGVSYVKYFYCHWTAKYFLRKNTK